MDKPNRYVDLSYLTLGGVLIGVSIYGHFSSGYVLTLNNYLAFIIWLIVLCYKIFRQDVEFFALLWLLFLSTFSIVNFTNGIVNATFYNVSDNIVVNGLGFNVFSFFLLLLYCVCNLKMLSDIYRRITKGSDREQEEKARKMIGFYYEKFNSCSAREIEEILSNYSEYPKEAQIALQQIREEKKNG